MKKTWLLPGVAAFGGIIGLLVRRVYLTKGFDEATGLPVDGQPYGAILWAVALLTVAVLYVLSRGKHRNFDGKYSSAFYAARPLGFICGVAGGVLMAIAGILNLMDRFGPNGTAETTTAQGGVIRVLLGVFCLLAGAGVYLTAMKLRQKGEYKGGWMTPPGFAACLWVMSNYQSWAKDPVLGHFLFRLLAVLLTMAACYVTVTFAFGKGRVALTLVLTGAAAAFGIMVLGDGQALYQVSLQLGFVFYLLSLNGCLAANDAKPEPVLPAGCAPADCQSCPGCPPAGEEDEDNA